jgi:hypothetical protein
MDWFHLLCNSNRTNTTLATSRGFHKYHYVPLQDLQPQNWVLACNLCKPRSDYITMVMIQSLHPISIQHFCAYNLLTRPFVNLEDASDRHGRVAPGSIYALRSGRSFIRFLKGIVMFRSCIFFSPPTWFFYGSDIVLNLCLKKVDIWSKQ